MRQSPGSARRGTLRQPSHSSRHVSKKHNPRGQFKAGTHIIQINKRNKKCKTKNAIKDKRVHSSTRPRTGWAGHTTSYRKRCRRCAEVETRTAEHFLLPRSKSGRGKGYPILEPAPRTDPTRECHRIHAEFCAGKKTKTPNRSSRWRTLKPRRLTSSCEKRPRWRHCGSHGP